MSNKEAILKEKMLPLFFDEQEYYDKTRFCRDEIFDAMDEYSAPFKKACRGLMQMYELDYPTTVHYMFRPDYLYAVEVMKGEGEPPNNYYKQLAEACERMYNSLVTGNFADFEKYSDEWKKLKSSGSTDIKM